jgi:hypothetical protein
VKPKLLKTIVEPTESGVQRVLVVELRAVPIKWWDCYDGVCFECTLPKGYEQQVASVAPGVPIRFEIDHERCTAIVYVLQMHEKTKQGEERKSEEEGKSSEEEERKRAEEAL